jgi:hypothetical protein
MKNQELGDKDHCSHPAESVQALPSVVAAMLESWQ